MIATGHSDDELALCWKQDKKDNSIGEGEDAAKANENKAEGKKLLVSKEFYKEAVVYESKYGTGSATGIRSKSTVKAYAHD